MAAVPLMLSKYPKQFILILFVPLCRIAQATKVGSSEGFTQSNKNV